MSRPLRLLLPVLAVLGALAVGCGDDGDSGDGDPAARQAAIVALVDGGSFSADGEQIYKTSCATCHGGDGQGGIGPELAGTVADSLTVEQHVQVVLDGRGQMPGWKQLDDDEIAAVIAYERTELGQ